MFGLPIFRKIAAVLSWFRAHSAVSPAYAEQHRCKTGEANRFRRFSQGEGGYDARRKKRFGILALLAIEGLRRRTDRLTTGGLGNIARAFAHRNYLVYVSGNSISLIAPRRAPV